jgi:flagellar assembly factor FliW
MTAVMTETDVPAIELIDTLPGFPDLRRFGLVRLDESAMLFSLQSLEDPDIRFLVVPPAPFFPDYAPEIDNDIAERLNLTSADDAVLLVIVTVGERPEDATANLLAPVVVNHTTLEAKQVVLADSRLPLRTPLHR